MSKRIESAKQLHQSGKYDEAERIYCEILSDNADDSAALHYLGLLRYHQGRHGDAVELIRRSLRQNPHDNFARYNLGTILLEMNDQNGARVEFEAAIEQGAKYPLIYVNLATIYKNENNYAKALRYLSTALTFDKKCVEALTNTATLLFDLTRQVDEPIRLFLRALEIRPGYELAAESVVSLLNYSTTLTNEEIFRIHKEWGDRKIKEISKKIIDSERPEKRTNEKIRIGFVSADLRDHAVSRFILPIVRNIDTASFEIYCYSNSKIDDSISKTIKQMVFGWRSIYGRTTQEAVSVIYADEIDVLIDLSGHTEGNRLDIFAAKPAMIQMTYLGYPNTTGLTTVDYRLTDELVDPIGMIDRYYTEKLIRFSQCFISYEPPEVDVARSGAPCLKNGFVTFGSFNNVTKWSDLIVDIWAKLLLRIPDSKLLLKFNSKLMPEAERSVKVRFENKGVDTTRIRFLPIAETTQRHLLTYNEVDIALDTFPYHGTTTTCEAISMGVPVVTLAGNNHCSRVGVSLLNSVGLTALIAENADHYIEISAGLAGDFQKIVAIRKEMNTNIEKSNLFNSRVLVGDFERVIRKVIGDGEK